MAPICDIAFLIGLVMVSIATGSFYDINEYGFGVLGCGLMLYSLFRHFKD